MSEHAELRDSLDKTREAFRRVESVSDEPGTSVFGSADDARRDAVRAAVADVRSGLDPTRGQLAPPRALHPFFQGLLDTLPQPGEEWPLAKRERWLETARNIFSLLYLDQPEAPVSLRLIGGSVRAQEPAPEFVERYQDAQSA